MFSKNVPLELKIHWTLRISAGLCFIGHGAFGIITKAEWLPFFAVCSIGPTMAFILMPLIGMMDIILGLLTLFKPTRGVLLYMGLWAIWTASLRPLAHMGGWEFLERAGNYGAPFTLLTIVGWPKTWKDLFTLITSKNLPAEKIPLLIKLTQLFTAMLLIGHGGFGAFQQKPMLMKHFQSIGLPLGAIDPKIFITSVGWFEIILGISVLMKPLRPVLLFIVVWKLSCEILYPISGTLIWEFVERWGSYGVPLTLYFLLEHSKAKRK